MDRRIEAQRRRYQRAKRETEDKIDALENVRQAEILTLYFVDCLSMEEIAARVGFSERHSWRLYSDAIKKINKLETQSTEDLSD